MNPMNTMTPAYAAVAGVYLLVAVTLIALILLQQKKSSGLGGGMSGMGGDAPQTYWDKNKGRSLEGRLHTYTKVLAAVMLGLTLVLAVL